MSGSSARSSFPAPDTATIEAIRAGNRTAADHLIRACEPKVLQMARRHAPTPNDADTLAEAGRVAVWRAAQRYDPSAGPFDNFASRAVLNAMRTEVKKLHVRAELEVDEAAFAVDDGRTPDPEDAADARGQGRRIRRAVRALPGNEFDVLFLTYGCGYTERRAASALGLSQPRVNQLRNSAIKRLAAAWPQNTN